jgi:cytoskeletal protein CcmA (bactofilin family)
VLNKNNRTVSRSSEPTIIGSGVKLTGTLQDEGPIIIHGSSQGTLISEETIFIGENAHIEGPVTAKTIKVSGKVEGELIAHEVLEITATGHITGKLKTKL